MPAFSKFLGTGGFFDPIDFIFFDPALFGGILRDWFFWGVVLLVGWILMDCGVLIVRMNSRGGGLLEGGMGVWAMLLVTRVLFLGWFC